MPTYKCQFCSKALTILNDDVIVICEHCGTQQPSPLYLENPEIVEEEIDAVEEVFDEPHVQQAGNEEAWSKSNEVFSASVASADEENYNFKQDTESAILEQKASSTERWFVSTNGVLTEIEPMDTAEYAEYVQQEDQNWIIVDCPTLKRAVISHNTKKIEPHAFEGYTELAQIIIPDGVTEIGEMAFSGCEGLVDVTVPNSVTKIDGCAFENCSSLLYIVLPEGLKELGERVFYECPIENATVPGMAVMDIPQDNLRKIVITTPENEAWWNLRDLKSLVDITFPIGTTCVGAWICAGCINLRCVKIPDGVTRIEEHAFADCSCLMNIEIPDSVVDIDDKSFENCAGLQYHSYKNAYYLGNKNNPFHVCIKPSNKDITFCDIHPKTRMVISKEFAECLNLEHVDIPNNVVCVKGVGFKKCEKLEYTIYENACYLGNDSNPYFMLVKVISEAVDSCIIHSDTRIIGDCAFQGSYLAEITIPPNVIIVGCNAFYGCQLTKVDIISSATVIREMAFASCFNLTDINTSENTNIKIDDWIFSQCPIKKAEVHISILPSIPKDSLKDIVVTCGTTIDEDTFRECGQLTSITLPNSITNVHEQAFANCQIEKACVPACAIAALPKDTLKELIITTGVEIKNSEFYSYKNLTSISLPDGITHIGEYAFGKCENLTSIRIPSSVVYMGRSALENDSVCNVLACAEYDNAYYLGNEDNPFQVLIKAKNKDITTCNIHPETGIIGERAFYECCNLTDVEIPQGVTCIGEYAFQECRNLSAIVLSNNLTHLGANAFCGCENVKHVAIGSRLVKIDYGAFCGCSSNLEDIFVSEENTAYICINNCLIERESGTVVLGCKKSIIPTDDTVIRIGRGAFLGCSELTSITIPDNINTICMEAFWHCGLTDIIIPSTVTNIEGNPFAYCGCLESIVVSENNTSYTTVGNCLIETENRALIAGCKNGWISTDDRVAVIGDYAFAGCTELFTITIPDNITEVGCCAFEDCISLIKIAIPDSVTNIGGYAFCGCTSLCNVTLSKHMTVLKSHLFLDCVNLENIAVGSNIEEIGTGVFENCTALSMIHIPQNIKKLEGKAFVGCTGLIDIRIDIGCSGIEPDAFLDCPVKKADVPADMLHLIPKECLTELYLKSVDNIAYNAFSDCKNLACLTFHCDKMQPCAAFLDCRAKKIVANATAFPGAANQFVEEIVITSSFACTEIPESAFEGCNSLVKVTLPDNTKTIGDNAFSECCNLTDIIIPNGVTRINSFAFYNCTSLAEIVIPDTVTVIEWMAFSGCSSLEMIEVPYSVQAVGAAAFGCCEKLSNVCFYAQVSGIAMDMFHGCNSLVNIELSQCITTIGENAFRECSKLTQIRLPEGLQTIESFAFAGCYDLAEIIIPDSVTALGYQAFAQCFSLKSVAMTRHLKRNSTTAFDGCKTKIITKGGCYIATSVYGSYDCPQVWTLRRYRDYTLAKTWYGRTFIRLYYAVSPTLVKWFGTTAWFKKMWKGKLDRVIDKLQSNGVSDTPYDDISW